ncbi:hypothetical protein [Phenylobacterium sp.]|uniref:hypothetical protein n=1 Tax=Phenylobacterium sp. TaxID=1871053 RepID=UPI0027310563|nr:hypothetical protein [Phenylobacterium sp.]MDP3590402.1 hypothetical protein [Phenylobacterium sp.]
MQAIGSVAAIFAAILISRREGRRQIERDNASLIEKRRAAFIAMETVIEQLGRRDRVFSGEVAGAASVLSSLDTSILPPNGMVALVNLKSRVALAQGGAEHDARLMPNQDVRLNFDAVSARRNLELARAEMGMI